MGTANSKPQATVFYSWQSDLPNSTNRGLILDALERAAKKIHTDDSIAVEPVLDRDTQNIPGAPDIAHTIFQKIEKATAFVADVSIINPGLGRPTPNPNVLIELGYALKTLGNRRTLLVANTAYGPIEALPFDLRTKRVLTYHLPAGAEDKPEQRKKLQESLETALRAILTDAPIQPVSTAPSAAEKALESIEAGKPGQDTLCARFMRELAERIRAFTPKLDGGKADQWDEDLILAIEQSLPLVVEFARLAEAAATHDASDAAIGLFRGFDGLFVQYNLTPGTTGAFYRVQFDFPKFLGHELMTMLFAAFLGERRWTTIAKLCRETIAIPDLTRRFSESIPVSYLFASDHVELLDHRNQRLKRTRVSLHADLLKERHEGGSLGELSPWRRFQDADVLLFLRSAFELAQPDLWKVWRPWSATILTRCPDFLLEAFPREKAAQLLEPLGVQTVSELRNRLKAAIAMLYELYRPRNPFYYPFETFQPDLIGTR